MVIAWVRWPCRPRVWEKGSSGPGQQLGRWANVGSRLSRPVVWFGPVVVLDLMASQCGLEAL